MHGFGTYDYGDGNIYKGNFLKDKKHGKGKYKYKNGVIFKGNFENNL